MNTIATLVIGTILSLTTAFAVEPTTDTLAVLRESSDAAKEAYRVYVEKYAHRTPTGETEISDSRAQWKIISREAKALWEAYDSLDVGDSIIKYPGLLAHGSIRWDDDKRCYRFGFGFHPFAPRDGLGTGSIAFDLTGKVTEKSKAKYPW